MTGNSSDHTCSPASAGLAARIRRSGLHWHDVSLQWHDESLQWCNVSLQRRDVSTHQWTTAAFTPACLSGGWISLTGQNSPWSSQYGPLPACLARAKDESSTGLLAERRFITGLPLALHMVGLAVFISVPGRSVWRFFRELYRSGSRVTRLTASRRRRLAPGLARKKAGAYGLALNEHWRL